MAKNKLHGYELNCCLHRLYNGQHIQMLTALMLQLIQCIVTPPKNANIETTSEEQDDQQKEKKVRITLTYTLLADYRACSIVLDGSSFYFCSLMLIFR